MNKTLIVVDAQYDFMPGGALAVNGGDEIIPIVNQLLPMYDLVIFTRDYHPNNHKSFASQHEGQSVFDVIDWNGGSQMLWPDHCIQGSRGSHLHDDIQFELCKDFYIFKKGLDENVDSYSGFYDNNGQNSTGLSEFLKERNIDSVDIVGLAGDYCVKFTALDSVKEGFNTTVIDSGVRYIDTDTPSYIRALQSAGVNYNLD